MKGRVFSATMLVIVLVLVLAVPAEAGKPVPPSGITISVGAWSYKNICSNGICAMASDVTARGITWSNASNANYLVFADYYCAVGTTPGPGLDEGCVTWSEAGRQSITAQGKLPSKTFSVDWAECDDYYPAILLVAVDSSQTQVLARALGPKIAGFCY